LAKDEEGVEVFLAKAAVVMFAPKTGRAVEEEKNLEAGAQELNAVRLLLEKKKPRELAEKDEAVEAKVRFGRELRRSFAALLTENRRAAWLLASMVDRQRERGVKVWRKRKRVRERKREEEGCAWVKKGTP